jgi:hypothetical protein
LTPTDLGDDCVLNVGCLSGRNRLQASRSVNLDMRLSKRLSITDRERGMRVAERARDVPAGMQLFSRA